MGSNCEMGCIYPQISLPRTFINGVINSVELAYVSALWWNLTLKSKVVEHLHVTEHIMAFFTAHQVVLKRIAILTIRMVVKKRPN